MNRAFVDRRIRLLSTVLVVAFAATFGRAVWLQAVRAEPLSKLATSQQRDTEKIPAPRGTIYDRTGVQLAIGEQATTVYADPREVRDPRAVAVAPGRVFGKDPGSLLPRLLDRSRGFVYVARQADARAAEALAKEGIVGLGFVPEERRGYPQGAVASEVVGYAGVDNRGLAGLELQLDPLLAGENGSETVVRDPFGRKLSVLERKPVRDGRDVYLTLDNALQGQVERVLRETRARWAAKSASAIVMDPRTGGILAMAVEPGFDANNFSLVPRDRQRNRAVTDTYEPGSTFKVVTLAAALETRMVSPSTTYTLPYRINVADRVIHDAEPRGTQRMTVAEILSQSSNVGVVTLALGLGKRHLTPWIDRFGFGRPTGIDYPGESGGIVLPPERWSGSTIGNVPIGQGIAVTPLQMASAYAAIANDGVAVQPHLLERVAGRRPVKPARRRVIAAETAEQLTKMLRGVVEQGSGLEARVPGYLIAGKTGTAAKPDPVRGGYSDTRYVSSFVGFVPATAPRLVVLVTVDEPRGTIWGGTVAAPAFREIMRFALQYLDAPPDMPEAAATAAAPDEGATTAEAPADAATTETAPAGAAAAETP